MDKKLAAGCVLICTAVLSDVGAFLIHETRVQKERHVTSDNSVDMKSGYRNIWHHGEEYQYNSRITTILVAGIDSVGEMKASIQYGNKARADSIFLVIMDSMHRKLTVLSISRDTMTQIRRYAMNGTDNGLYTTHIGYAYSYGDGGEVSCENLSEAVSLLLGEIPINYYLVANQDSMVYLNDLAGDITVTVPNADMAERYPEFQEGARVTLTDDTINTYLRYRDTDEAFSNERRMERHRSYVTAYIDQIQSMSLQEMEKKLEETEEMNDHLQTNIARNKYLDILRKVKDLKYEEAQYRFLDGESREGELHDEFYPDAEMLQDMIIELFYLKI